MGTFLKRKDDGRRVIQWIDGNGKVRQESLETKGLDGKPLTARSLEQLARRRIAELEEKARRQRHGLEPMPSEALGSTFGELRAWWWEQKGRRCAPRWCARSSTSTSPSSTPSPSAT